VPRPLCPSFRVQIEITLLVTGALVRTSEFVWRSQKAPSEEKVPGVVESIARLARSERLIGR
jgi:hypothetical protein